MWLCKLSRMGYFSDVLSAKVLGGGELAGEPPLGNDGTWLLADDTCELAFFGVSRVVVQPSFLSRAPGLLEVMGQRSRG